MSVKEAEFWRGRDKYHGLAEQYERNIELTHPDITTGMCPISKHCVYPTTTVVYYEYRGERV